MLGAQCQTRLMAQCNAALYVTEGGGAHSNIAKRYESSFPDTSKFACIYRVIKHTSLRAKIPTILVDPLYRARLKGGSQVWKTLLLLLHITSASPYLQRSRNLRTAF